MANAKETRSVKNNIGLALFILILVAMFFIPTSETLTAAGRNSLGLLLATIVCMLTGGLPIGVLCMLVIPLMYICGCVETPAAALAGFQNQSAFFMLASFDLCRDQSAPFPPLDARHHHQSGQKCQYCSAGHHAVLRPAFFHRFQYRRLLGVHPAGAGFPQHL